MKNVVLIFLLLLFSNIFFGQTLARYGNHNITKEEFLKAFRKNNTNIRANEKAYRDYLNLYIRYRLKVQAAYDLGLDTLAGQLTELQNFKSQIVDQYLNDESSLNQMAREAFVRSQHDLRVSYNIRCRIQEMHHPQIQHQSLAKDTGSVPGIKQQGF